MLPHTMKPYISVLLLAATVGGLSMLFPLFSRADNPLATGLGPLLSPAASIVLPSEPLFANLTRRCVGAFAPDIAVVVRVGTEADVPLIIAYAKRNNRTLLAASGRHGWDTSLNNVRAAIMVDISPLSTIIVDSATNTMTIGGGVTVGDVIMVLHAAGKETPVGGCDCVGFLGLTLGGGHGRLQGRHGLMADNLISARLTTANADIITVSNTSHASLFWGLRGAGHNFGIVTSAVFQIYDQESSVDFNADLTYEPEHLSDIFTALNTFSTVQPADITVFVIFVARPSMRPLIALSFISISGSSSSSEILDRAFGHLPYSSRTISSIPSNRTNTLGSFGSGASSCASTARKNAGGVSMTHYHIPSVHVVFESFAAFVAANPDAAQSVILFESYPVQAVVAVPAADTAYPHRAERHIVLLLAIYHDVGLDGTAAEWLRGSADVLHAQSGFAKPAVYVNYANGWEEPGASYGYEEWRREKLKELKRRWDPESMFSAFHPIPMV